jgi:hypothetical protein
VQSQYTPDNRDYHITSRDISRIQLIIEKQEIRMDDNDAISTRTWIKNLSDEGHLVIYKDKQDPPPVGSDLAINTFFLCIQTQWQLTTFRRLGNAFLAIDATHNTTQYFGLQLFTLLVRDHWGHGARTLLSCQANINFRLTGVPVAWMLSSSGTQATIQYFLKLIKGWSPTIYPSIVMTDCDRAQINAIQAVYPRSRVLYCWWHVLRAMRMHFNTSAFPELWKLIKEWVRIADPIQFYRRWAEIQSDTSYPESVVQYLRDNWMPDIQMWSAISRQNRTIFEEGDTNMLIEA